MSKKTTETKLAKQAEKKHPTELKDARLDEVVGGNISRVLGAASSGPRAAQGDVLVHIEAHDSLGTGFG